MAIFGSMTGILDADTTGWSKGFQSAGKDMSNLDKQSKSFYRDLKSNFGKGSPLSQALKLAAGGGAIAGLSYATHQLDEFTAKIATTADAFRKGDVTVNEFFSDTLRGLPVLGSTINAFDNLREAITGEKAAMEEQEKAWADTKAGIDAAIKARDAFDALGKEGIAAFAGQQESASQSAVLAGMPEGIDRDIKQIQYETENKLKKLNEDFAKFASTDAISALEKQLATSKDSLENNPELAADGFHEGLRQEELAKQTYINQQLQVLYKNRETLTAQSAQIRTAIEAEGYAKTQQAQRKAADDQKRTLDEQVASVTSSLAQMAEASRQHGEEIAQSLQTPLEKYQDRLADLSRAFREGTISEDIFGRGAFKALDDFQQTKKTPALRAVQAEELRGEKYVTAADVGDGQKEANDIARKQLEKQLELIGLTKKQILKAEQEVTVSIQ